MTTQRYLIADEDNCWGLISARPFCRIFVRFVWDRRRKRVHTALVKGDPDLSWTPAPSWVYDHIAMEFTAPGFDPYKMGLSWKTRLPDWARTSKVR
jgi:hypothetical protein